MIPPRNPHPIFLASDRALVVDDDNNLVLFDKSIGSQGTESTDPHVFLPGGKRVLTVTDADLTNAVNGSAQVINLGVVLPANAVVIGFDLTNTTPFAGGGTTSCLLDVGGTIPNDMIKTVELITDAVTIAELNAARGLHFQGRHSAQQLTLTFTPDGGHALLALTSGSVTIEIWYIIQS